MKFLAVFVLALALGSSSAILPGLDAVTTTVTGGLNGIVALVTGILNAVLGLLGGGPGGLTDVSGLVNTIKNAIPQLILSLALPEPLGGVAKLVLQLVFGLLEPVLATVLSLTNVLPLP